VAGCFAPDRSLMVLPPSSAFSVPVVVPPLDFRIVAPPPSEAVTAGTVWTMG
jgi:hypothetical protein